MLRTNVFRVHPNRPTLVLIGLGLILALAVLAFMTVGAKGSWDFILPFRGRKLAGMALAGTAIALSTVLFQTITNNRILTPAIMGFDALYRLIQTSLVFFLGGAGLLGINPNIRFLMEAGIMTGFALALFSWLFKSTSRNLHVLVLVGFVFGALFRSLSDFMQRIISPNEFVVLQDRYFARFSAIDPTLLAVSTVLILTISILIWRKRNQLDVIALGRDNAINLGINYTKSVSQTLIMIAILVSASTALVGPVTFFGLLVANLAYQILGTARHAYTLPAAAMLSVLCLAGGQMILEQVFAFNTSLSIIIEFIGGIVFIALLLKGNIK